MAGIDKNSMITLLISVAALGGAIAYAWWDKEAADPPKHEAGPAGQDQPRPNKATEQGGGPERPMYTYDTDGDGKVSPEEFQQVAKEGTADFSQ
jgi:hypothetical protein